MTLDYIPFVEMLTQKFEYEQSRETTTALLCIEFHDLSRFNDTFGFRIDEDLIVQISSDIGRLLNEKDVLTRAGNHQLIIMHDLSLNENTELLAKRIVHMLSEPCVIKEHMFYIQASIGVSLYPSDESDASKLIKSSIDTVVYIQKKSKGQIGLTKDIILPIPCEKTIRLMSELPAAIENEEIYFLYQAQYSHEKECFVGAELLSRWDHPEYGAISPYDFIPIAEQTGMIGPLTIKAFCAASEAFVLLERYGLSDFSLSINISPIFLMASNFDETIDFLMEQYDLRDKPINLEITEEILLEHTDGLLETLKKLKSHNIDIQLDDFGTGYTSLQHLAYFPIDTLKIDRSFVVNIDKDIKKRTLFHAIVDMANALNVKVIAEGVENTLEDSTIKQFGSIDVQGYFYSKPVDIDQLIVNVAIH